jgi:hypothetical protein
MPWKWRLFKDLTKNAFDRPVQRICFRAVFFNDRGEPVSIRRGHDLDLEKLGRPNENINESDAVTALGYNLRELSEAAALPILSQNDFRRDTAEAVPVEGATLD